MGEAITEALLTFPKNCKKMLFNKSLATALWLLHNTVALLLVFLQMIGSKIISILHQLKNIILGNALTPKKRTLLLYRVYTYTQWLGDQRV